MNCLSLLFPLSFICLFVYFWSISLSSFLVNCQPCLFSASPFAEGTISQASTSARFSHDTFAPSLSLGPSTFNIEY
ncbi:hypothetical protein V8C42DRAFT_332098 [Trichoderma barbatum]